ncbi:MAG TPA: hypothetical protein VFL90_18620 [Methylomirabilota bacterium]|nr:hypothetical protein [Methylomirabilota bacterium]
MKKQATKHTERVVTDLPIRKDDVVKGGIIVVCRKAGGTPLES